MAGYPAKKFVSLGFEGHAELFGPHPFMWKNPTPTENIRTKKFGFGCLFSELIFGKGMRTATFQFSESGNSLNGPDLFTELPDCLETIPGFSGNFVYVFFSSHNRK